MPSNVFFCVFGYFLRSPSNCKIVKLEKTFCNLYFSRQNRLLVSVNCKTVCKTLFYEVFELINSNYICMNMSNATYNDPDVEVADVVNGVPSIIYIVKHDSKG